MSLSRQVRRGRAQPDREPTVRSLALQLPAGHRLPEHTHEWAQVVYAARGVLAVEAASTRWVVPPLRCLWVPAGVAHRVETIGEVLLRTVYIRSDRSRTVAASLRVLDVSPLDERAEHRALALLMLAEIGNAPQLGLALTSRMPTRTTSSSSSRMSGEAPWPWPLCVVVGRHFLADFARIPCSCMIRDTVLRCADTPRRGSSCAIFGAP
jgi:hypothetical protein